MRIPRLLAPLTAMLVVQVTPLSLLASGLDRQPVITANEAPGGLLDRMQRQVVTELEGTQRLSTETWTLADLP